ncbi:MarR family winged helix-turn-helix transcriptional regulator [Arthrobacter cryoconiti]|uniref:MarR family winged helix-turn-helix transcriptional regulator n=1 Tax=Arthrobacter cryoconiti TaxID=748907 RepID=A0ABV8R1Y6_9MICC
MALGVVGCPISSKALFPIFSIPRTHARLGRTFARHGLDAASFDVLATLLRSGVSYRITPVELAREAMITTSPVAQRLNKLEGRGLIQRALNPTDAAKSLRSPMLERPSSSQRSQITFIPNALCSPCSASRNRRSYPYFLDESTKPPRRQNEEIVVEIPATFPHGKTLPNFRGVIPVPAIILRQ